MEHTSYTFLGKTTEFWVELQQRFEGIDPETALRREELVQEICTLRMKLVFYESRIDEMYQVKNTR